MTSAELDEIASQRLNDPAVLGRLACNLRSSRVIAQRHHDGLRLGVVWHDSGDFWRCTIFSSEEAAAGENGAADRMAQIDIHENATVRMDVFEPCRVTISPEEGILCLTRYRRQ